MTATLSLLKTAAVLAALSSEPLTPAPCSLYTEAAQELFVAYLQAPKRDRYGPYGKKDEQAAERWGMTLKQYTIDGLDEQFVLHIAALFQAARAAGFTPAITTAFRDRWRQSIVAGKNKNSPGDSYHGSKVGYSHGVAVDVIALATERGNRWKESRRFWDWIDQEGSRFNLCRPFGNRDAPHVTPCDGKEYLAKRTQATKKLAAKAKPTAQKSRLAKHRGGKGPHKHVAGLRIAAHGP